MSKKLLVAGVLMSLVAVMLVAGATTTSAQTMSLCQTVDALVLAGVIAPDKVAAAKAAAGCTAAPATAAFTRNLTVGSTGADVTALQTKLGVTPATGYFGAITKAAVMAYQTANGIAPVSGYVGPLTLAKLNAGTVMAPVTPVTPVTPGTSMLEGGVGEIADADFVSSLNNEEVGEGESRVQVLGLGIEAGDDSDIKITSAKITLEEASGADLDDFVDSVSVMFGSKVVGTVEVNDFNETSGVWSKTVNFTEDVVIKAEDSANLYVAVSSLSNIDSSDLGSANNDWNVQITNVRFVDADGAVVTEDTVGDIGADRAFFFDTLISANDVELTIDDKLSSPDVDSKEVDENGGDEIVLLIGELEADGADITVTELMSKITVTSTTGTLEDIASSITLKVAGDDIETVDTDECVLASGVYECTFEDVDVSIDAGEVVEFSIVATLNEIEGDFAAGDSLSATVDSNDLTAETEDDDLTGSELTGTATGEAQSFYEAGISAVVLDSGSGASTSGNVGTFTFKLDVTAFGDDEITLDINDFVVTVSETATGVVTTDYVISKTLSSQESNVEKDGANYTWDDETGYITLKVYVETLTSNGVGVYTVTLDTVEEDVVDEDLESYISYSI